MSAIPPTHAPAPLPPNGALAGPLAAALVGSAALPDAAALEAARPSLEALAASDPDGQDVLLAVRDLLQAKGAYTEDAFYAGLDLVSREAVRRVKLLTLQIIAPVVYEMRQTKGWARLVSPLSGTAYDDFDQWADQALGLSHTKATNLCTVYELVLPAAAAQGMTAADVELVDESKLMLVAPLMQEHRRTVDRVKREAELHGTPAEQVQLPPTPNVADILEYAKTNSWQDVRQQVLTAQGVQKESVELQFLVARTEDGRYEVHARLTRAEMLRLDERLRPRWLELHSQLPVSLHDELREADPS